MDFTNSLLIGGILMNRASLINNKKGAYRVIPLVRQFLYRVIVVLAACLMTCAAQGAVPQDTVKGQKPRYTVRRTTTETVDDVKHRSTDLRDPANLKNEVTYDEKDGTYSIGTVQE